MTPGRSFPLLLWRFQRPGNMHDLFKSPTWLCLILLTVVGCGSATEETTSEAVQAAGDPSAESESATSGDGVAANEQAHSDTPDSGTPNSQASAPTANEPARPQQLIPWEVWEQPDVAVVLTGEQHGFFEPCGCTADQLGGMSRRADLIGRMKKAGWTVTGVDLGGLPRRTGRQAVIKAQTSLKALTQLGYMAVGLGTDELKLGIDGLLDIHLQEGDERTIRFVSANVSLLEGAIEELPLVTMTKAFGDVKIGITSVLSESHSRRVFPMGDAEWKPPTAALEAAVSQFAADEVDLRILLSNGSVEESTALAAQFPQFQVVVTADGLGDPDPNDPPQQVGETMIIEAGRKGKHVGVLGVYQTEQGPRLKYKLVSLEREDFGETQSMIKLMVEYQNRLREERIVESESIGNPHPSGATFVGADKCAECHTTAYDIWKNTGHAHALEDLDPTFKRHGHERLNGVNRTFDPECLSCHVTGWDPQEYTRFKTGFLNAEFATTDTEKTLEKLFGGSQCENCHGPGSRHIEMVENGDDNPAESVILAYEDAKNRCIKCHDGDNSPNFDFEKYWKRVEHVGLD